MNKLGLRDRPTYKVTGVPTYMELREMLGWDISPGDPAPSGWPSGTIKCYLPGLQHVHL